MDLLYLDDSCNLHYLIGCLPYALFCFVFSPISAWQVSEIKTCKLQHKIPRILYQKGSSVLVGPNQTSGEVPATIFTYQTDIYFYMQLNRTSK